MLCKRGTSVINTTVTFSGMHVRKKKKRKKNLNFEINEHQCLNTPKLYLQ